MPSVPDIPQPVPPSSDASYCVLPALSVIEIAGPDAATFLQGQLSSDVLALAPGAVQYSSYNSPKGRMLANFTLSHGPDGVYRALLAADLAASIAKRLGMFVLRAKVTVRDQSARLACLGFMGRGAGAAIQASFGMPPPVPGRVGVQGDTTLVGLPDGRVVAVLPREQLEAIGRALQRSMTQVDGAAFDYAGIAAGVPLVTAATSDQFVPQTANWEILGGVAFDKGCYTGQEIVARMQYLGRLKERLYRFHAAQPVDAGARLYASAFGDQACGTVVNAAPDPAGGCALLAVVQIAAADDTIHVASPEGALLARRSLPYELPAGSAMPREKLR